MKKTYVIALLISFLIWGTCFSQSIFGQQEETDQNEETTEQPKEQPTSPDEAQTGQDELDEVGEPVEERIGVDTAQQKLKEYSVSKFEDAAFWNASISQDKGVISMRTLEGGPMKKEQISDEAQLGLDIQDKNVLGVKVHFYRRAPVTFAITPIRPLVVPGIAKSFSIWVVGRNYNHTLKILLKNFYGDIKVLTMGKLNFSGWEKLTVAVPPTIKQGDYHYNRHMGVSVIGFIIECDISETYGSYYVYFDDLRAVTDLFAEESRDKDDMQDNW